MPNIIMQPKVHFLNDGILICEHLQRVGVFGPLLTTAASYEYARDDRFARETRKTHTVLPKKAKGRRSTRIRSTPTPTWYQCRMDEALPLDERPTCDMVATVRASRKTRKISVECVTPT